VLSSKKKPPVGEKVRNPTGGEGGVMYSFLLAYALFYKIV